MADTDFKRYLSKLLRLCAAIIEHGNDSDQAEVIREEMDDNSWFRLSPEQQDRLRGLSAAIQSIETEEHSGPAQ